MGAPPPALWGERVGAPMASAPGVGPFRVERDGADGAPVARPT